MEIDPQDVKRGTTWFFVAGVCALALSAFLQWADYALTTWDVEDRREKTLKELRGAQIDVGSGLTDIRQLQGELSAGGLELKASQIDFSLSDPSYPGDFHHGAGHH